jgi:hypothetical protein
MKMKKKTTKDSQDAEKHLVVDNRRKFMNKKA